MPDDDPTLALDVDADDYATTAAEDTPTSSSRRREQSEADFEAQRASYTAKFENGDIYKSLPSLLPRPLNNTAFPFGHDGSNADGKVGIDGTTDHPTRQSTETENSHGNGKGVDEKPKLDKKHIQLVTAAVGELYYLKRYAECLDLISWVGKGYAWDGERFGEAMARWEARCRDRLDREQDRDEAVS